MDGQHQYEITLKKDDLFINLSSDDVYFISKQMDKWFRILLDDSYVPVTLPQRPEPVLQSPEPLVAEPATPEPEAPPPVPEVVQAPQSQPEPVAEVPVAPPAPEPKPEPVAQAPAVDLPMAQAPAKPAPPPAPEVAPVAPPVEPQPEPQPVAAAVPQPVVVSEAVNDDFEAVMDTLMKDLESAPEAAEPVYAASAAAAEVSQVINSADNGAASVGEIEMDSHGEPDLAFITSLADLCDRSNASNSEDYLLLSAYFLTRVEHQTAFSMKKVNSVLVKSGLTPINHSVLESVLSRGYLAMVPDLTGTAEVSEYSITPDGQQAATQLL